eukprot:8514116-Lingulodinium_polyedra.AAC.1
MAAPTTKSNLLGHGPACTTMSRLRSASSTALRARARPSRGGPARAASEPGPSSLASAASSSTT